MKLRFIDTGYAHPFFVTAADEAIAAAISENKAPDTLHIYMRDPPGVSLGRFRSVKEINLEECRRKGVEIVRRISGGGSIFTDRGCLIYSLASSTLFNKNALFNKKPEEVFKEVCGAICDTLKEFGVKPVYKPPNDVLINGKKVSGSALIRKGSTVLIHGTILVSTDIEMINRILLNKPKILVTNLERERGKRLDMKDVKDALLKNFERRFGVEIVKGRWTNYEKDLIDKLVREKFSRREWNFSR